MHKLFHINRKKTIWRFNKVLLIMNAPTFLVLFILLIISDIVAPFTKAPPELYRIIHMITYFCVLYGFLTTLIVSLIATFRLRNHYKHTFIEITEKSVIISQYEKTVFNSPDDIQKYIELWIMDLSSVEDVSADNHSVTIKGKARHFNLPQEWLEYEMIDGKPRFENWWNEEYGGENVTAVKITDYYTYSERILRRILLCAERCRKDEKRKREFREKMLAIANSRKHKRGIGPKYKEPPRKLPREGIKERKW